MSAPANAPLVMVRGKDETVLLNIDIDDNETPVNITGRTYVMAIGGAESPLLTAAGTVDGPTGLTTFEFAAQDTATLSVQQYAYDVVQTTNGKTSTLILSSVNVLAGVSELPA